jgi:hypothetical protein
MSNAPKPCSHFESVALHNQRTTRKDCDEENLDSNRYAYRDVEQLPVKDAVPDSDAKLNKHAEIREKMAPKIKKVLETVKRLQNHDPK